MQDVSATAPPPKNQILQKQSMLIFFQTPQKESDQKNSKKTASFQNPRKTSKHQF